MPSSRRACFTSAGVDGLTWVGSCGVLDPTEDWVQSDYVDWIRNSLNQMSRAASRQLDAPAANRNNWRRGRDAPSLFGSSCSALARHPCRKAGGIESTTSALSCDYVCGASFVGHHHRNFAFLPLSEAEQPIHSAPSSAKREFTIPCHSESFFGKDSQVVAAGARDGFHLSRDRGATWARISFCF